MITQSSFPFLRTCQDVRRDETTTLFERVNDILELVHGIQGTGSQRKNDITHNLIYYWTLRTSNYYEKEKTLSIILLFFYIDFKQY